MSKRAILVLAAVVLALVGYIAVFERGSVTSKELEGRSTRVLASFVRAKVSELAVQRKGTEVVLVRGPEKDGVPGDFQVTAPYRAEADDDLVDHLLGELEWLSARRTLESVSEGDQRAFGLLTPRVRVRFSASGERHTLAIGNADVHGEGVYVQVDRTARAYVVPKTLLEVVEHEPGAYRAKQLFPELTVSWVRKLKRTDDGVAHAFEKREGRWWTSEPSPVYANEERMDELLRALAELRAARFPAKTKLVPSARIELSMVPDEAREDAQAKAFVLEIGGPCADHPNERYVQSALQGGTPLLSCVTEAALAPLLWNGALQHEPHLFASEPNEVTRIVLARGAQAIALSREGTSWKAQSGVGSEAAGPVDGEAVESWLEALRTAEAEAYAPLGNFVEHIILSLERVDKRSERVAAGNLTSDGSVWVRRGDEPSIARFSGSVFDRLQPSAGRFRALALWPGQKPSEVVGIDARAGELTRTWALKDGAWSADNAQSDRVRVALRELLDQRAQSYLGAVARPAHGFDAKGPRLELRRASGGPLTLELGAASEHGGLARVDGSSVLEVGGRVAALVRELAGGPVAPAPVAPANDEPEEDDDEEDDHDHAH